MATTTLDPKIEKGNEYYASKSFQVNAGGPSLSAASADAKRGTFREKVFDTLKKDTAIPAVSVSAQKLQEVLNSSAVDLDRVAEVVQLDPGLMAKYLKLANSVAFGGKSITSVQDALFRIGMNEIQRVAAVVGVVDRVSHLRVKVDWNLYLLHCILTARLTECLTGLYRISTGKEYLAGLLHDIGKLFLEHYFPREFESVVLRAVERNSGMFEAEGNLLGITHAEISAGLCEKWGLHKEIIRSIRFHHEPDSPFNKDPANPEMQTLLAICICVADDLANVCKANIQGSGNVAEVDFETLRGWQLLQQLAPRGTLDLDVAVEYQKAKDTLEAMAGSIAPAAEQPGAA